MDFGVFNALILLSGTHNSLTIVLINTLAVTLAAMNSFFLNRNWTFPVHNRKNGQITRFVIASLIGILINSATVYLLSNLTLFSALAPLLVLNFAKIIGALLSTSWNFISYRNWVFRAHEATIVFQPSGFIPGLVSIIIPAFNEELRLPQRLQQLATSLPDLSLEILVVDDGSSDHTLDLIRDFAREYPFIRYLEHKKNQGKGAAVRTGMHYASGEYLIFTDADITYTPEHIRMLAERLLNGADIVIACREGQLGERLKGESLGRKCRGKIFNLLVQILLLPGIKDSQCGLKGFSHKIAAQLFPRQRIKGFAFDVELLALLKTLNQPITVLEVAGEDCSGSTVRQFLTPLSMTRDIIKIKFALLFNLYGLPNQISFARRWSLAAALFILALLVRIPWLWEVPRYVDELKEVNLAYQIYLGEVLPLHNMAHDIGALHNYILAGIFKIMGASIYWPRFYVALTSALTVVLIYYIGKKLFGQWVGITAALLLMGNGMHILVTHMAWSNCTTPFFFCLAFLALLHAEEKKSGIWLIISAFLWALTLQTHSSVIIYILAVTLYVLRPGFRYQTAIERKYYYLAGLSFLLAYANMIYFNLISKGGSFNWLRYKGYAIEKDPGLISYLQNLQEMFIELLRAVSSTYTYQDSLWHYLAYPGFTLALFLILLGTYLAYKEKRNLPFFIIVATFLLMPWINHRYVFFLATRYIMPVLLCLLLLLSLAIVRTFTYTYEWLGRKRILLIPAFSILLSLMLIQLIPFYDYCAHKAGTNQSNRLALQVFQKTMELSDRDTTLVVLDKSLQLENNPLPYLLTLAQQPYLVSNADILAFSQSGKPAQKQNPYDYQEKKIVGVLSASNFKALRSSLSPQKIDSYSCKLVMPSSARGERTVYVLDLGSSSNDSVRGKR